MKKFIALSLSDVVFIMVINVKMPTILGILTLWAVKNLCSAELSMKKSFITSAPCCKTWKDTKYCITKQAPTYNGSTNKEWIKNNRTTTLERTAAETTDVLNWFY